MIGKIFSHYKILEKLGEGGMGIVYKAQDTKLNRPVALKFPHPDFLQDKARKAQLLQEAQAAAAVNHPNICTVYEIDEIEGQVFIAMEYVEGQTLKEIKNEKLKIKNIIDIAIQITLGLQAIHDKDMVHRDIKSDNIHITKNGQVKIMDFGLVKSSQVKDRLTETESTSGTVAYMSPEQIRGEEIDHRSDIWSFGVVLYEMLTGRLPFQADKGMAVIYSILDEKPIPITDFCPDIPTELEYIVNKTIAKHPRERYQHIKNVTDDLCLIQNKASRNKKPGLQIPDRVKSRTNKPSFFLSNRIIQRIFFIALVISVIIILSIFIGRNKTPLVPAEYRQITYSGDVLEAALSPDGEFVTYISKTEDVFRLMVQELKGGSELQLYSTHRFLFCPRWSPDGSQILVTTQRLNGQTLLFPRFGSTTPRSILTDVIIDWSSDGSQIVSWWPQSKSLIFTNLATGDTTGTINIHADYDWLNGVDWSLLKDRLTLATQKGRETFNLWTIKTDGTELCLLLEDSIMIHSPQWSHDACAIYFLRGDDPVDTVWKIAVNKDGTTKGSATRLLSGLSIKIRNSAIPAISLSADGRRLLYTRWTGYSNLWLFKTGQTKSGDLKASLQLTSGTALQSTPRISPDGTQLVFTQTVSGRSNIFTIPIEGGPARQLTFTNDQTWSPAWSPNGTRIAFGSNEGGIPRVWVMAADGSSLHPFDKSRFLVGDDLAWAPGKYITYQLENHQNYHLLDPETGEEQALLPVEISGWFYDPQWSPDGKHIALRRVGNREGLLIFSAENDLCYNVSEKNFGPIGWSATGNKLFVMSVDVRFETTNEVYQIKMPGGETQKFTTLPFPVIPRNTRVNPDGLEIITAVPESHTDVWMVKNFDPERN